ncbi:hypothetical protein BKA93DRAFT_821166 [Sparassis latifolia]
MFAHAHSVSLDDQTVLTFLHNDNDDGDDDDDDDRAKQLSPSPPPPPYSPVDHALPANFAKMTAHDSRVVRQSLFNDPAFSPDPRENPLLMSSMSGYVQLPASTQPVQAVAPVLTPAWQPVLPIPLGHQPGVGLRPLHSRPPSPGVVPPSPPAIYRKPYTPQISTSSAPPQIFWQPPSLSSESSSSSSPLNTPFIPPHNIPGLSNSSFFSPYPSSVDTAPTSAESSSLRSSVPSEYFPASRSSFPNGTPLSTSDAIPAITPAHTPAPAAPSLISVQAQAPSNAPLTSTLLTPAPPASAPVPTSLSALTPPSAPAPAPSPITPARPFPPSHISAAELRARPPPPAEAALSRSVSAPFPSSSQPQRTLAHTNSLSPGQIQPTRSRRPSNAALDLDRVDELDETDPRGLAWHHDGPYEAIKRGLSQRGGVAPPQPQPRAQSAYPQQQPQQQQHHHTHMHKRPPGPAQVHAQKREAARRKHVDPATTSFGISPGQIFPSFSPYQSPPALDVQPPLISQPLQPRRMPSEPLSQRPALAVEQQQHPSPRFQAEQRPQPQQQRPPRFQAEQQQQRPPRLQADQQFEAHHHQHQHHHQGTVYDQYAQARSTPPQQVLPPPRPEPQSQQQQQQEAPFYDQYAAVPREPESQNAYGRARASLRSPQPPPQVQAQPQQPHHHHHHQQPPYEMQPQPRYQSPQEAQYHMRRHSLMASPSGSLTPPQYPSPAPSPAEYAPPGRRSYLSPSDAQVQVQVPGPRVPQPAQNGYPVQQAPARRQSRSPSELQAQYPPRRSSMSPLEPQGQYPARHSSMSPSEPRGHAYPAQQQPAPPPPSLRPSASRVRFEPVGILAPDIALPPPSVSSHQSQASLPPRHIPKRLVMPAPLQPFEEQRRREAQRRVSPARVAPPNGVADLARAHTYSTPAVHAAPLPGAVAARSQSQSVGMSLSQARAQAIPMVSAPNVLRKRMSVIGAPMHGEAPASAHAHAHVRAPPPVQHVPSANANAGERERERLAAVANAARGLGKKLSKRR